jgi:MYXO-CTERM domain-containing protein
MVRSARPALFTLLAVGAAVSAASSASADVAGSKACDGKSFVCSSKGAATLHAESREAIMTSIGTGWLPACATPDAQGHCSDENIQVATSIDLTALRAPSTEPLWMVDMARTAVVNAAWPTTSSFDLTIPTSATQDGTFKVSHSLVPAVHIYANISIGPLSWKREWTYTAADYLANNAANYDYKGTNAITFLPWAFETPAANLVPAPSLTTTTLIDRTIVNDGDNVVNLALAASTSPTFSYRTTKVSLAGATPISAAAKVGKLPMRDADYLDLPADVEGEITVKGDLTASPYVWIKKIGGTTLPGDLGVLDLTNAIGTKKAYDAAPPVTVIFPKVTIHIPLANIKAPSTLDLGTVTVGAAAEKALAIPNTGELSAKMLLESSDPQFTVDPTANAAAKGSATVNVRFKPTKEGEQTATIKVHSNDPDSPEQTITVRASATPVPVTPPAVTSGEPEAPPAGSNEGCGCRTVSAPSGTGSASGVGLVLALGLLARRRRSRAAS